MLCVCWSAVYVFLSKVSVTEAFFSISPILRIYIYIYQSTACRLSVTMVSSCAKTSSNGLSDRTAHGLVSSNQRAPRQDVIMARKKPPVSTYYGACPFNFTISHNSVDINGKICPLSNNTSALFVHQGLTKSRSMSDPDLGCARATAPNLALLYWST